MPLSRTLDPLKIDLPVQGRLPRALLQMALPSLEKMLRLGSLGSLYRSLPAGERGVTFVDTLLQRLEVGVSLPELDRARVPADGPLIVVANHPFGALEGMVLAWMLGRVRPDFRIMANLILNRFPETRELFLPVDPFGRAASTGRNIAPLKNAIRWVRGGHCLGIFPAGEVASLNIRKRSVLDPEWSPTIARLVRLTKAPVLPVYFKGANGALFHLLGLLNGHMRTAMLPREFLNKRRTTVLVAVGTPVPFKRLERCRTDAECIDFLRTRTYLLANRFNSTGAGSAMVSDTMQPVAPPGDPGALEDEILGLPQDALLCENGRFAVLAAPGLDIPLSLAEIGRIREVNFRAVGEGTGMERDLDRFDTHYLHLVLWDRSQRKIAGAYRMGPTDHILNERGPCGLYTTTLFRYKKDFLRRIDPALELGRAFVDQPYRKSYSPLMLLWKGIGTYVGRNPRYRILFGPVSISNTYHPFSRKFMVAFLKQHHRVAEPLLLKGARPRSAPRNWSRTPGGLRLRDLVAQCRTIEDVSGIVSELEGGKLGVPVLLRQYLKLGGTLVTFNQDRMFCNALDGLILVDLMRTPESALARHLGPEPARAFRIFHQDGGLTNRAA